MTKDALIAAVGKLISDNWPAPIPPPTSALDPADIVCQASADLPFAQQKGCSLQAMKTHTAIAQIAETGVHGPKIGSETLRFGKVQDPANSVRKALTFMVAPSDQKTSGGWRAELAFGKNIEIGKVYWAALSAYVFDWGGENANGGLYGVQLHAGDDDKGLSPAFGIYLADAKNFRIENRGAGTSTVRHAAQPIAFGKWQDFVFQFKQGTPGFIKAWVDGRQIVDYQGNLGYPQTGFKDYFKFGWYNWAAFTAPRRLLLRNPVVVLDPSGSKYGHETMLAFVNRSNP